MGGYHSLPTLNPPQDIGEGMQRILAMKGMMQQQAGQQQEQKLRAIEIQKAQQQQQDLQTAMPIIGQVGGDMNKALPILAGKVSPQYYQSLMKSHADTEKELSEKNAKDFDLVQKQHGALADLYQQAQNLPDDQYTQAWPQIASRANEIEPKLKLDPSQPVPKPTLQQLGIGLSVSESYIKSEAEKRAAAKAPIEQQKLEADTAKAAADASKSQIEADAMKQFGYMTPGMAESRYLSVQTKANQGLPISPDDKAFKAAYEKNKTLVPAFNIKMQNSDGGIGPTGAAAAGGGATGAGAGAAKDPTAQVPGMLKGSVQAVLDYRSPMPPQGRNNARNNAIRDWVNKIDPTYDETTFPARNKILTEYVKSAGNGPIGAINTALGHLGELNEAAKALDKNDIPLLHSIASKVGAAVGDDAATTYTSILHRVGPEMTSAYVQGGGGQAERGANEEDFAVSKGQKQILSNIGESAKLLRSKMSSLENNWNQTFRPANDNQKFENRFITPQAKATLNAVSAQAPGGTVMMKAPNGQMKPVPADQVEHYKALGAVPVNQ